MIPSEKLFCVHKVHDQKFDFDYFGSENVEGFNFTQIKNTHLASLKEKLPAIGWKKKTIKKIFEKTNSFRVRKRFRSFFFFFRNSVTWKGLYSVLSGHQGYTEPIHGEKNET